MKKIYICGLMLCAAVMGMTSCSKDVEHSDTRVTHFANIELNGDDFMKMQVGETYNEPGYTATEGTEDITAKVVVTGKVDSSKGGFYTLTYTAVNKDNFAASVDRTVMVVNPQGIASAYFAKTSYFDGAPITITDKGNGDYEIDDLMAGYYFYYKYPGYEPTYDFHLETVFHLNDDNTLTHVKSGSFYFSSKPTLASGSYDPATGTVSYKTSNGLSVVLTK